MLGRRDNRYTTAAPELSQVIIFSCFADLDFLSSVHLSKITENFACLNEFSSRVRQFFWSYLKYSSSEQNVCTLLIFRFHKN